MLKVLLLVFTVLVFTGWALDVLSFSESLLGYILITLVSMDSKIK